MKFLDFNKKLKRHVRTTIHLELYKCWIGLLSILEDRRKKFVSFKSRPQDASHFGIYSDKLKTMSRVALVLQGPLVKEKDFTLETIKMYQKTFVGVDLIVSTWKDEDPTYIERIRKHNVKVLLNEKPTYTGQQNINFQIVGSHAGIQKAKELGVDYVFKTRTDQRMYAPSIVEYLINLIKVFPLKENSIQKKRLIGVSLNTYKYRLYAVSDMLMFGAVDDMLLYWGAKLDDRPLITGVAKNSREFASFRICETYLTTEFLQSIGEKLTWTLYDSWKQYGDHFCIVDQESIGLYWFKYNRHKSDKFEPYAHIRNTQELTFSEWLNMYADLDNKSELPEYALDKSFVDAI